MRKDTDITSKKQEKSPWILVASRTEATIFASRGRHTPLTTAEHLDNPRGDLQSSEIETDRPGRSFDRAGHGRHAYSSEESARDHVEHTFVTQLAELLDQRRCEGVYDQLVVIAGPKLLGMLRKALSKPVQDLVKLELNKELVRPTEAQLRHQLSELVAI